MQKLTAKSLSLLVYFVKPTAGRPGQPEAPVVGCKVF